MKGLLKFRVICVFVFLAFLIPGPSTRGSGSSPFLFEDVTEESGLSEHLQDWVLGHGGAWGDVTGNGLPDLYIGAFANRPAFPAGSIPNMLFLNEEDGFTLSSDESIRFDTRGKQPATSVRARCTMALFADLNNNGKLDLLVGNQSDRRGSMPASFLFENRWPDSFRDVTPPAGVWPSPPARHDMRNVTAVDLNWNGLLDLVLLDRGGRATALRNKGDFTFEDISEKIGFPAENTNGLGLAVGDVNNNGRPDFFIPRGNTILISRPDGTYREYRPGFFREPEFTGDPCAAYFADLTGNDLLDLVFNVHGSPAQLFIYVNRGIDEDGLPDFENVTETAGLDLTFLRRGAPLPWKSEPVSVGMWAGQLVLADVDNNGRRDILLGNIYLDAEGRVQPVVFRNEGTKNGVPQFTAPSPKSWLGYYATAPVADYNRNGRLDIFMTRWHEPLKSFLFRNVTDAGNYLTVNVAGKGANLNTMGVGAVVRIYKTGHAGEPEHLLGRHDMFLGNGYSSGDEARAHFGLGTAESCDVRVTWQGHEVVLNGVSANRHLEVTVTDDM